MRTLKRQVATGEHRSLRSLFANTLKNKHEDLRECRYCRGSERSWEMVAPCDCKGSMTWCHVKCGEDVFFPDGSSIEECGVCQEFPAWRWRNPLLRLVMHGVHYLTIGATLLQVPLLMYRDFRWINISFLVALVRAMLEWESELLPASITLQTKSHSWTTESSITILAYLEATAAFYLYCLALSWSVDFGALGPSFAKFLVCELFIVSISFAITYIIEVFFPDFFEKYLVVSWFLIWGICGGIFLNFIVKVEPT